MTTLERGAQTPRALSVPGYVSTSGAEAVELCALAGLELDPWQALVLEHALGEREDGRWAAFEVGVCVSRQNGKGALLEARELAGLFLLGERLIVHSAHQFDTSLEAFRRLLFLVEDTPDFDRRVQRVSRSHGEEGIELKGGQRIRFRTRTKGGGRGFTADCLILDEAMIIPETSHGALLPTLSARPNPQVWYTGSAVDQAVHDDGVVFSRIRARGQKGDDPSLAYFEWSAAPAEIDDGVPFTPDHVTNDLLNREVAWADANPGLGIRISAEHVQHELASMDRRTFAVERLGVGDWPRTDGSQSVIDMETWAALLDEASQGSDPGCFAFDISPDRSWASISFAGRRSDDRDHIEVVDRRRGTGWVVDRLEELKEHKPVAFVCDAAGPAGSLLPELEQRGIAVTAVSAKEYAQACGILFDKADQDTLRHIGQPELDSAVKGASQRPLGDAWAWARKTSAVDISPLVSATLALFGLSTMKAKNAPVVMMA